MLSSQRRLAWSAATMRSGFRTKRQSLQTDADGGRSNGLDQMQWKKHSDHFDVMCRFSVASFNLLAPVYKRLSTIDITTGFRKRESQKVEIWSARANRTAEFIKKNILDCTDIVGFQEFWMDSTYQSIFGDYFQASGHDLHVLQRPGEKSDGVALIVRSSIFEVLSSEHLYLCMLGDRVALLLWLRHKATGKDVLVANTHLSFPHSMSDRYDQLNQMQKLTNKIEAFAADRNITHASRIIMGDFNVESKSPVCDHLRELGYVSCFEISPPENADGCPMHDHSSSTSSHDEDTEVKFISHRTHRSEDLGVDHVFVRPEGRNGDRVLPSTEASPDTVPDEKPQASFTASTFTDERERMFIDDCYVLPKLKQCGLWDESFLISDHRPVSATIIFARQHLPTQ